MHQQKKVTIGIERSQVITEKSTFLKKFCNKQKIFSLAGHVAGTPL